ncbi:MAG: hypothetical protein JOS17DRAFT_195492 [Linnemannia elongata]|nr:MAG: hypothetical protein JOS17DRAFT_195492 [Linnemannia elongata]
MMSDSQWPHQPQPTTALASLQTVDQARAELEARLMGIHNDLQLTQTIGLLFVKRQEDLKHCFDQLQELKQREAASAGAGRQLKQHQEPLPDTLREQLAILDREFQEGQNGILGLKGLIDAQLGRSEFALCVPIPANSWHNSHKIALNHHHPNHRPLLSSTTTNEKISI